MEILGTNIPPHSGQLNIGQMALPEQTSAWHYATMWRCALDSSTHRPLARQMGPGGFGLPSSDPMNLIVLGHQPTTWLKVESSAASYISPRFRLVGGDA